MVFFAIIAIITIITIFDHYYKFCDVFEVIFERKTIRNVPKPKVLVKIRNFIPKGKTASFSRISVKVLPEARGREKTGDNLATKLFLYSVIISHVVMWSSHVFNMKTWFQLHSLILCCFAML
jgi:hypothetical protein